MTAFWEHVTTLINYTFIFCLPFSIVPHYITLHSFFPLSTLSCSQLSSSGEPNFALLTLLPEVVVRGGSVTVSGRQGSKQILHLCVSSLS